VTERAAIGVDVGGTKVAALLMAPDGTVLARDRRPVPADDEVATVAAIVAGARAVSGGRAVAVGVAGAGLVDHDGLVHSAPNLSWREVPLAALLSQALGLPSVADNDGTAAAWAEYRFGVGSGARHLLMVSVGTGIGGGLVHDGRPYRGANGFAGEIGHIVVEPGGPRCGCGNQGCWETVASGSTITRAGAAAVTRHPHSALVARAGGDPEAVTGAMVTETARDGDPACRGILVEVGHRLGVGIAGLVNVLDPDRVVVGGGVSDAGELVLAPARDAFRRTVEGSADRPEVPIVRAGLGADAAAVGAAALAFEMLDGAAS
jgi:glucokinase